MQPSSETPRVIVVGGGIAGLSTAYLIRELGREAGRHVSLTILEARDISGGSTRTDLESGYICEWGPNGFLDNEPATLDLVKRLDLSGELVRAGENAARRYIYHSGRMREVPTKPPAFLKSDIVPLPAKLRMAMELVIPAKRNGAEETVYEFGRRRLGSTFATYLLDPMVSGIFAGNARELSLPAVFPKMVEMEREYGGLFRALIAKQKAARRNGAKTGGPAGAAATLTTFRHGMGQFTAALASQLNRDLVLSSPARSVERSNGRFVVRVNGSNYEADSVVLAAPSYETAALLKELMPDVAREVDHIPFAPVDVVCHGHARDDVVHPLDGFGVLIPRHQGFRILGSLWCDGIFPQQAPEGHHLLRTIAGGAHDPKITEISTSDLEDLVHSEHRTLLGVSGDPSFRRVFRHAKGIAQYTRGHLERVASTERAEQELPGLYFTGASYRGVSVNGCCKDAFRVANLFWKTQSKSA